MSAGQRFMTDLLVSSLMADGGLENALNMAFRKEVQKAETKVCGILSNIELLILLMLILKNNFSRSFISKFYV